MPIFSPSLEAHMTNALKAFRREPKLFKIRKKAPNNWVVSKLFWDNDNSLKYVVIKNYYSFDEALSAVKYRLGQSWK